ncbi:MAG: glutamine amidotransferase-related protein, partial [Gemmataceae bacterium]
NRMYGSLTVQERHRHRYEFNNAYRAQFEAKGMVFSGTSPDGKLVEIIELPGHPWYLAVQCHPEFRSKPTRSHPLFHGFVQACLEQRDWRKKADGTKNRTTVNH